MTFHEKYYNMNMGIIDLSDLSVEVVPLDEPMMSEHIGGAAVNRILFDRYGSDNPIVLGTGPLTGSFAPASCLMVATFRSPLSGRISNVPLTMRTGPEMKFSGFDFLVIKKAASQPQIISVHEGTMAFRAADLLMNRGISEASGMVRRELQHLRSSIMTGPAADNRAVAASVSVSRGGSFDKTGLASVMASKNIKSIVFDGIDGLPFGGGDLARAETMMGGHSASLHRKGHGFSRILEQLGAGSAIKELLPTKKMRPMACYHCPFPCMSHVEVRNARLLDHNDEKKKSSMLLTDHLGFMVLADKCKADVFPIMAACNEGGLDPVAVAGIIPRDGSLHDMLDTVRNLGGGLETGGNDVDNHGDGVKFGDTPREETDRFGGGIAPLTVAGDFDSLESWKKRVALSMILGICPLFLLMFPAINDGELLGFIASEEQEWNSLQERLRAGIDTVCRS